MLRLASNSVGILSSLGSTVQGKFWKGRSSMLGFFHLNPVLLGSTVPVKFMEGKSSMLRFSHSKPMLLGSNVNDSYSGGFIRTCASEYIATATELRTRGVRYRKPSNASQEFLYSTDRSSIITRSTSFNLKSITYSDAEDKSLADQDLKDIVTVFVFDLETTGFSRVEGRIAEIAFRDLQGGLNSCFQTLVNTEQTVHNSDCHGITTEMVDLPEVPRMEELIPILLKYIKSRQKPGGPVLLVAHNARVFDLPFLINEFSRCSYEIPPAWLFLDSLPLARQAMKLKEVPPKLTLSALGEYYGIRIPGGSRHRAMSDVNLLTEVFARLTMDLELSVSDLLERAIRPSDVIKLKNKKSRSKLAT